MVSYLFGLVFLNFFLLHSCEFLELSYLLTSLMKQLLLSYVISSMHLIFEYIDAKISYFNCRSVMVSLCLLV